MKRALITGVTGQDGSYLAELLLTKGYEVHGIKRRSSSLNTSRIDHIFTNPNFYLHYGDLSDGGNIMRIIQIVQPDEIYNLGAMSHVKVSFDLPEYSADIDGLGPLRILEAVKSLNLKTKIYQASTSELYGKVVEIPQSETTPFNPQSPYAIAKHYAYSISKNYREAYGMYICNGILFNHGSPRRGETFVERKITIGIANIINGKQNCLVLGNLNAKRDWGHAKDYVVGMWLMLQQPQPDDYVLATGVTHSVREFLEMAFAKVDTTLKWEGQGIHEQGIVVSSKDITLGQIVVTIDPKYFRPTEVDLLLGDPSKAKRQLGWTLEYDLDSLCTEMIDNDLNNLN